MSSHSGLGGSGGSKECNFSGQVVHIRKVSKRLCFVDFFCQDGDLNVKPNYSEDVPRDFSSRKRCSAIFKSWVCGGGVMSSALKGETKIHCGDSVLFSGRVDETGDLIAEHFTILNRWKDCQPGQHFLPIPPPPKTDERASESPCKFWLNTGNCPKGEGCKFRHEGGGSASLSSLRISFVEKRLCSRKEAQQSGDINHSSHGGQLGSDPGIVQALSLLSLLNYTEIV